MYHIPKDKRAYRTAKHFVDTLEALLQTRKLDTITVSELCRISGNARRTFYRLFDSLIDVLQYHCDTVQAEYFKRGQDQSLRKLFTDTLHELTARPYLLKAIMDNDRIDWIYQYHLQNTDELRARFSELALLNGTQMEYFIHGISIVFAGYLRLWYVREKKESPEIVYENLRMDCALLNKFLD